MAEDTVSTLNSLIETLEDGRKGFESAASKVEDIAVKSTFTEFAQQRARLAGELQSHVQKLGAAPQTSGSTSAAIHRGWIDLKSALGAGEKAILNEAERGEDIAVKGYEKALQGTLPADVDGVVRRQYGEIKQAHDRVKQLRDSWK